MLTDSALELAKLVSSDDFQRKLNDLIKERELASEEIAKANKAKDEAEQYMAAARTLAAKQHAELEAKRKEHDKSSDEAARRIALVTRMNAEAEKKGRELDEREKALAAREKAVEAAHSQFSGALAQLGLMKP